MKAILISIRPEWVAAILNGDKTIEIRKTAPKCDLPIDVYIYCTEPHAEEVLSLFVADVRPYVGGRTVEFIERKRVDNPGMRWSICNGKVVAKFTLREVERIYRVGAWDEDPCVDAFATNKMDYDELLNKSCLKETEMDEYLTSVKKTVGYAYHISDLQIFDKPKELSEFKHPYLSCGRYCGNNFVPSFCRLHCSHNIDPERLNVWCDRNDKWGKPITKAPQSWCYVEVSE